MEGLIDATAQQTSPIIAPTGLRTGARVSGADPIPNDLTDDGSTFVPERIQVGFSLGGRRPVVRVELRPATGDAVAIFLDLDQETRVANTLDQAPAWVRDFVAALGQGPATTVQYAVETRTFLDGPYDRRQETNPWTSRPLTHDEARAEVEFLTGARGQYAATRFVDGQPGARVVSRGVSGWN